jgi:RimJ/RimL family protein N-acetyltransferase
MVQLVPMTEEQLDAFLAQAIPEYAADQVRAGNWAPERALDTARGVFAQLLPRGTATRDHYLFSIWDEDRGVAVGSLWFGVLQEAGKRQAFVYDVRIAEAFRHQGYGTRAFRLMEERVRALGLDRIGLHVFAHNHVARAMYEKLGYETTNLVMYKQLEGP